MWKIVRCPKCGAIQATCASVELRCKSCGAASVMHSEGQCRIEILAEVKDAKTAGYLVRRLKLMEAMQEKGKE